MGDRFMYDELLFKSPYHGTPEYYYNQYLREHQVKQNKGERGRDTERTKTYRAEWALYDTNGYGREFDSIAEVQKYVNKVTKSKTYRKLWQEAYESRKEKDFGAIFRGTQVSVAPKKRNGAGNAGIAYVEQNHIVLDTHTGMNEYTVLHELAHCVGHPHHGRSFRRTVVKLTSRFMGTEAANALKVEFKQRKLPYGEPRKPKTFDQWMAAKARMENIRNG
jgi:putative metallohydrolase (TIGR04338 family)